MDPGLVLHSRKAPSTYRFPLRLTGVTARVDEADGSVVYEDENGEPVFRTPRPWMMDSAYGDRVPGQTSLGASYHLVVGADGGQVLELRLSQTWLQDPARVYPVKVDPTLQSSSVGNGHPFFYSDTSYASHNPYSAYTSDGGLYIGADNHGHRYRAVLQFGGGAKITPGDGLHYVHSATFGVHQAYAFNCYREVYAKRVTESWVRHEDSWAPQLGPPHDPHGGAALTAGHACPPGNVGWLHFDVTETARRWEHDPAIDNHGLALLGSFTWNDTARGFYSQNHWDASIHPYMSIIWENTAPTAGSGGSPADGAVLTSKPVLFARYDDADGDWGVLRWNLDQRQPDGVSWSTVFDFVSGNPWEPGATASQGIDQHLSGGVYRWRVQAGDGSSRGDWSGYQTFTIEVPPAAPSISSSTHPSQEAWYSNPSAALSWTEPGSHAGINGYSYALDRSAGTVPDTTSEGTSRTASFGGLVDGVHYFHVRARNNAGQWGDTAHFAVRVHTASPAGPSVTSSTHPDPNVTYPNSAPTLNWTAPASMSGIDGYSYTLDTTPSTVPDTVSEGAGTTKSYSGLADQTHYFHVRARTGAGVWGATTHFTVRVQTDQTPPTPVVGLRSTSHLLKLNSDNRTLTMTWAASTDTRSGMAGYDVLFNTSATSRTGTPARVVMPGASRAGLVDGAWYAHVRPVDNAGNRGVWVTAGPYLIGEATLTEALPGPVAQSSETGLEQFAPMEDHDTGNGRSHVHLRTGNLVSTLDLATVPGHGLNTVVRLTHNNSAAHRDAGVGRGWSLSVTDLDAGLDGMLGDVADGAVTDLDINRDLALADVTSAGGLVQDAAYTGAAVTGRVLEFTDGDGTVHRFVRDGGVGSRWSGPPGVDLRVREDFTEDAAKLRTVKAYELIRPDGVVYRAENVRTTLGLTVPVWRVVSATDRNGNRLSYTHASFGPPGVNRTRLTEIRHSRTGNDPVVTFAYAPYNATQAASGVDDGGVLRSMTTLPGHTSGGRSWERRTTFTITPDKPNSTDDHRLVLVTENAHNAPAGVDLAQRSTAFDYHDGTNLLRSVSAPTAGATVAATVAKTQFTYTTLPGEARPRLTGITDRAGKPWSYSYTVRPDGWTRTVATRPVRGSETTALTYEIDARGAVDGSEDPRIAGGNLRTVTNAGTGTPNRPVTTRYEWYANKLTASIDGVGVRTSMTYNDLGLLTSITQPPPNTPGTTDLPVNAPTTPVTSRLSYRDPHTGSDKAAYPSCEAPPAGSKAVSRDMWCSAVAELVKTVFAEGSDEQRVTDFGYHGGGDLASVTERVRSDGVADLNDRTTTFDYFRRGGLRKIDGPRTDVDDITCYGQAALAGATGDCASPPADADLHGDYDRTGMPRVLRDAAGKTKTYTYSPYGLVLSVTDRDGRTTTSSYDERDNLLAATDPAGRTDRYSWDAADNKLTDVEPSGKTTSYRYDQLDRLDRTVAPGGRVSSTVYFDDGTVEKTNGPRQTTESETRHSYWPNRQLRTVSAPTAPGTARAETTYEYDLAGRVVTTTFPVADAAGNRPLERLTYTPDGQIGSRAETAATGDPGNADRVTRFAYDAHGAAVRVSGPRQAADGTWARNDSSFDRFGQLVRSVRVLRPGKEIESRTAFDQAGNQVLVTQATGDGQQLETRYRYDALNRLSAQLTDPSNPGHDVTYAYTGEDQQAERTDWRQNAGVPEASCADTGVDCTALRTTLTTFNADNSKRSQLSVDRTKPESDPTRSLATCNYAAGADPQSGYDVDGNLLITRTVRGTGADCAGGTVLREQSFAYTDEDWLRETTQKVRSPQPNLPDPMITRRQVMTHFPDGRTESVTHVDPAAQTSLTTRYATSDAGWVTQVTDWRNKPSTFTYLPSGDVAASSLGGGTATAASTYAVDGMISSLIWSGSGATAGKQVRAHTGITYDVGGLRIGERVRVLHPGKVDPEGGDATYIHDLLDRLTGWTSPFAFSAGEAVQPSTNYTLDDGGNTLSEAVRVGATVRSQTESVFAQGRLTRRTLTERSASGSTDGTTVDTYTYNTLGEETRRASSATVAGLPSPVASSTDSRYDPLGHPVLADATNPPTGTVTGPMAPLSDVAYDYDTADRVLTRTETGNGLNAGPAKHTVYFYWGSGGSLAEETDGTGRTKVRYLLDGDSEALAQQSFTVNPDGTAAATGEKWTWLLHDAVGNTATLLADDGAVVEQKAFDPYGAPSAGGSARSTDPAAPKSTLGFQSTMTDEVTGKVMLGSRQYDPTTARFTTPDTFIAAQLDLQLGTDSLTGNRYLFAAANPLAFYEDGHGMFSRLKKLSKRALPALQYVPVVSTAIDVASAATGRNWYEGGRRMKGSERLAMLAGSATGLIPGGGIARVGVVGALKGVQKAKQAHKARKAADSCVANSFTPATLVLMADGTSTPISDIEIGDLVWAADPETGQAGPRPVTDLIEGTGVKKLVDITVDGDTDGPLIATDGHPIWVEHQGWTDADDLALGDLLRQADGDLVPITALHRYTAQGATVHNLTVNDLHTYHVLADEPILVHNCGGNLPRGGVYTLRTENDIVVRTGRTKSLRDREYAHGRKYPDLRLIVEYRTDSKLAQRGLEIMVHRRHRAILDKIRPVRRGPLRAVYIRAARDYLRARP